MDQKKFYKSIKEEISSFQNDLNNIDKRKQNSELRFQEFAKSCKVKIKKRTQNRTK